MRAALAAMLLFAGAAGAAPERVVSMNLCADQLAMLIGAPGQLVAVSDIARDPLASALAEEAKAYPTHSGQAEEVFLLAPDLVLGGAYTTGPQIDILRRLGVETALFAPVSSLEGVRETIRRMGELLGREARAEALVAEFDAVLAAAAPPPGPRPTAAVHYANAYTSGAGTLADAIIAAAGLDNLAAEMGVSGLSRLPLERLVMAKPDVLISGRSYEPPSLAEQTLSHPALAAVRETAEAAARVGPEWVCGGPFTARAVARLAKARARAAAMTTAQAP